MVGTTLSHYRILEPLGSGGMGEVYLARDLRLERDVAIKVLPAGTLANPESRKWFRSEALALARLNHPNIAAVYDYDQDGERDFLVMELVPGHTLSDTIARGPLAERDVRRLGRQLADGLAAAHRQGVLHRDIKPGNLRITPEGRLKILDFGLAKLARTTESMTGTRTADVGQRIAGTLPYMAPEQLRGDAIDARADIYAAGAVLYEAACGKRAFPQETTTALIGAVLAQHPPPPRDIWPDVPTDLERVILKCLEKEPIRRYESAEELAADLKHGAARPAEVKPVAAKVAKPRKTGSIKPLLIGGAVAAVILVIASVFVVQGLMSRRGAAGHHSLAVLPLANLSGDPGQEFFADGMTDELITRLAQVSTMRVISRSSVMQYKDARKPLRSIAKELGVGMVVEGSVAKVGSMVRISAQLVDASDDRNLWAQSYERTASNVILLESEIAKAIVANVAAELTPEEKERIATAREVNAKAHEDYLRGLYYVNQFSIEGFHKGITLFQRSIQEDSSYAPPYAGLASAYCALSSVDRPATEAMPKARAAADQALALDPNLAAAYVPRAYVDAFYNFDWAQGERTFRRAIQLNPNEAVAHLFYGQLLMVIGRYDDASREVERARTLDPLSSYANAMAIWPLYLGKRFKEAGEAATRLAASDPKNASPHFVLGLSYSMAGDPKRGADEFHQAYALDPRPNYLAWVGWAKARQGDRAGATQVLNQLEDLSRATFVQPYNFAILYAALGQRDRCIAELQRGLEAHSEEQVEIRTSVAMDPVRPDPRFKEILRKMNLAS